MPWVAKSGNKYNLCMLDTNALSEILKYPLVEGKGFRDSFPPDSYAPCFSVYSLIELRRNEDVYNRFIDFFSIYPIFMLKPKSLILEEEKIMYGTDEAISVLFNAFSLQGVCDSYNLKLYLDSMFAQKSIIDLELSWREDEKKTLNDWFKNRDNFIPSKEYPNSFDAEKYMKDAGLQSLIFLQQDWCKQMIDSNKIPNIDRFPSLKTILYSFYYRLYDPAWKPAGSDVVDLAIISAAPYVDIFITEKFQANIFNKIKNKVKNLNKLDVKLIKDLRSPMKNLSKCGVNCSTDCKAFKVECAGCNELEGKVSWAEFYGKEKCPIYECSKLKGFKNCNECGKAPCDIWLSTRNPDFTDDQFKEDIDSRLKNFKEKNND
ncbi:MAG: DUF3795 domain-containing protein [Candidatus Delongbacteria bacterium]|jgi:hypothetical protein|nr:DUF3795 domain-containing protein [Candidatus Delongbacteria bacterium]